LKETALSEKQNRTVAKKIARCSGSSPIFAPSVIGLNQAEKELHKWK
jgi:hypothetical protein